MKKNYYLNYKPDSVEFQEKESELYNFLERRIDLNHTTVCYAQKKYCLVQPNNLIVKQYTLSDGRLFRIDSISPNRGNPQRFYVTVEPINPFKEITDPYSGSLLIM
jgi:hypothetical protein